jgi:ribose transport system ATP-binding protein
MTAAPPLLQAEGLAKYYGAVVALRSGSLEVRSGEIHALMGANGAGKSTLVKVLTGAVVPNAGRILVDGTERHFSSPSAARRAGLASVYQDASLIPDLSVAQNLRLTKTSEEAAGPWLEELELQDLDLGTYVRDLPGPTVRLVDLARTLATRPRILILDEITAALPADLTERVFRVARRWRSEGRAVIMITHRMTEVRALCDRATVLRDGVTVGVVELATSGQEHIVALMLGEKVAEAVVSEGAAAARKPGKALGGPALEVHGLRRGTLQDVSFTVHTGEVLGIAALEAQGQEELFACLSGDQRPEAGQISAGGRVRDFRHPHDAIAAGLVLVPAERLQALLPNRSVRENVALPLVNRISRWGLIRVHEERRKVQSAIERLHVDTRAQSRAIRLSGGNQQKLTVARWLASGFNVLLCFDPTRGIDVATKQQIYEVVRELADGGAAVLLFTSELPEIRLACDRCIVLFGGRIVQELKAAEATEAALLRAAHGLPVEMVEAVEAEAMEGRQQQTRRAEAEA